MKLRLLLGLSAVFVVMGLALVPSDWRLGLSTVGLFGIATAVFAFQLGEERRSEAPPQLIPIRGGVPITVSLTRRLLVLGAIFGGGASAALFGYQRDAKMWWLGLILMVGAAVMALLAVAGISVRRGGLTFTPEGIRFHGSVDCLVHFDNLARLQAARWRGKVFVLLTPINLAQLLLTVPEAKREEVGKAFSQSMANLSAPLSIWASQFGWEPRSLMKTIDRWVREPATRQELQGEARAEPRVPTRA